MITLFTDTSMCQNTKKSLWESEHLFEFLILEHTEAKAKWQSFCRWHFQIYFLVWIFFYYIHILLKYTFPKTKLGPIDPINSTSSVNSLVPTRWQAIIRKMMASFIDTYMYQGCFEAVPSQSNGISHWLGPNLESAQCVTQAWWVTGMVMH